MSETTTPAALPRNREADEWRRKYEDTQRMLEQSMLFNLAVIGACMFALFVTFASFHHKMENEKHKAAISAMRAYCRIPAALNGCTP